MCEGDYLVTREIIDSSRDITDINDQSEREGEGARGNGKEWEG